MASVKGYFLPPIRRKLYAHGKLPRWLEKFSTGCTLSTGFLWLLVTDFFVHWQSGFLCSTLRHRFARSVPWHGWCLVRTSTAVLPKRTARPTGFQASQCTMCVGLPRKSVHILGSRFCTRNPEWVVRRHCGDGPAGYRGGVSALSGASCYSQHCH